jgi:hypothetical protein
MSILVDKNTRLVVQGITGREGSFHTQQMLAFGTNVVGGVTPGKGGQWFEEGNQRVPIFDSVKKAVEATGANVSIIFVPARFAVDAIYESADAGIALVVCLTEYIPVLDMITPHPRRCFAVASGACQPDRQRLALRAAGQPIAAAGHDSCRQCGRWHPGQHQRQWTRTDAGTANAGLRPLLALGCGAQPRAGWFWPGAGDCPQHYRSAWRHYWGGKSGGAGDAVLVSTGDE